MKPDTIEVLRELRNDCAGQQRWFKRLPNVELANLCGERVAAFDDAIRELEARQWKPISEVSQADMHAAKLFVLWSPSTHTYTCQGRYWSQHEAWENEEGDLLEPTHFQPLPEPPNGNE